MKIEEGYSENNLTKSECFGAKYLKVGVEYGDWRQVLREGLFAIRTRNRIGRKRL